MTRYYIVVHVSDCQALSDAINGYAHELETRGAYLLATVWLSESQAVPNVGQLFTSYLKAEEYIANKS